MARKDEGREHIWAYYGIDVRTNEVERVWECRNRDLVHVGKDGRTTRHTPFRGNRAEQELPTVREGAGHAESGARSAMAVANVLRRVIMPPSLRCPLCVPVELSPIDAQAEAGRAVGRRNSLVDREAGRQAGHFVEAERAMMLEPARSR